MRAHPRSRGENRKTALAWARRGGSSPLTRGKRVCPSAGWKDKGLIPAHAGKTCAPLARASARWAHPRSRGENFWLHCRHVTRAGSSPLTRGKREILGGDLRGGWLIPAHAGKTLGEGLEAGYERAHPRSRGENIQTCVQVAADLGSSPLTRGKPLIGAKGTPSVGLIPAHAGKTPILVFYRFQAEGSSPLTRGKPSETVRQGIRRRLIPAHAGKTASRAQSAASRRAHPRSRGENELVRRGGGRGHGSSPLTRGKLGVGVGVDHVGGLIPAHAGKTYGRARGASPTRAHPRSRGENRAAASSPAAM